MIYGIVKQCGGWIFWSHRPQMTAPTFHFIFPPTKQQTWLQPRRRAQSLTCPVTLPGIGKTILLVEDEPGVRVESAALAGKVGGYKVHTCVGASEAKAVFAKEYARIDLCLVIALIGQNGIDSSTDFRKQILRLFVCCAAGT